MKIALFALALTTLVPAMAFDLPGASKLSDAAGSSAMDKGLETLTKKLKSVQNDKGPIVFEKGKAVLDVEKCQKTLDTAATIIKNFPGSKILVQVEGYTDNKGSAAANKKISEQRAQAVADWLKTSGGVEASVLVAKGFGPEHPVADNGTEEGRAKNRRVDFSVSRTK